MFIDTHAHIYLSQFDDDLDEMMQRALKVGVGKILMPNIDVDTFDRLHAVEQQYPKHCFAMMGLHPCSVNGQYEKQLDQIKERLEAREYIAVGEIGLDLYWDKTYLAEQIEAFKIQTFWAHERKLPIVIHSRDSTSQLIEILEDLALPGLSGVFHCFSGNIEEGIRILDLGFYLGIGGVSTFKNGGLDLVLPEMPLDRLILETDAPYLAPHPYRGKRNESAYIPLIAERLGSLYNCELKVIEDTTTQNANFLFSLSNQPNDTRYAS